MGWGGGEGGKEGGREREREGGRERERERGKGRDGQIDRVRVKEAGDSGDGMDGWVSGPKEGVGKIEEEGAITRT